MADTRLAIVQDYVPKYRLGFFNRLVHLLAQDGIECIVIAGQPLGVLEARGDAVSSATWLRQVGAPKALQWAGTVLGSSVSEPIVTGATARE